MKISNKRKFNKINLCDLMKELGRNFACLEINKAFNTLSKNHSAQGFEGCVVMNCNKNSELKTNSPRHICESTEVTPLCHAELARVSRGWNAFAKVDKTILQNVELPFNANEQDISASYQRGVDKFSVSRHCERSEAIQEEMVSNRLLRRFTPRNDNKKVGVK